MRKVVCSILAAMLLMILLLTAVSCDRQVDKPDDTPEDPGKTDDPEKPDDSGDAESEIPTRDDFDPSVQYQLPDYTKVDLSEYVTLGKYKNLTLTVNEKDYLVTDAQLDAEIETILQENHPGAKITDRKTVMGDTVVASYVGKIDGVAFSGGTASNQEITLSSNSGYIPGFVEGMVDLMPGVATDVPVTFPENYGHEEYAGKDAVFTITVSYIVGHPEATDAFIAEYTDGEFETVAAYRAHLKETWEKENYDTAVTYELWDKIADNAAAKKYVKDGVMYYYSYYYMLYSYQASMYGLTFEIYLQYSGVTPDMLFSYCLDLAKTDMVRVAVLDDGGFTCTDEEYNAFLTEYATENYENIKGAMPAGKDYTLEEVAAYCDSNYHDSLVGICREEKATKALLESATINVKPVEESAS